MTHWEEEAARTLRRARRLSVASWVAIGTTGALTLAAVFTSAAALLWVLIPLLGVSFALIVAANAAEQDAHDAHVMLALYAHDVLREDRNPPLWDERGEA